MSGNAVAESSKILKAHLGITDLEARILLPLYKNGNMTAGGIALLLGEKLAKVNTTLKRLETKGFVILIKGVVPIYQAVPPSLTLTGSLSSFLDDFESMKESAAATLDSQVEAGEETADVILKTHQEQSSSIRGFLDDYELKTVELVSSQIESVSATALAVMSSLSEGIESALSTLDTSLENDLGMKLTQLQTAIDKSQKSLAKDVRTVSREFKRWLKQERLGVDGSMQDFRGKATALIKMTKSAIKTALTDAESTLSESLGRATESFNTASSDLTSELAALLGALRVDLSATQTELNDDLTSTSNAAMVSLEELLERTRDLSGDEMESARLKMQDARTQTSSTITEVETWKTETIGHIESASRSVTSQFEQAASADQSYVEIVRNTLVGHLDKLNSMVAEDYTTLSDIATGLESDFAQHLEKAKVSLISSMRKHMGGEQKDLEDASETLKAELETLAGKASQSIKRKLTRGGKELSEIVDSRVAELDVLSTKMSKRLKSSFGTVVSKASTANETLVTDVTKLTQKLETQVDNKITAVVAQFGDVSEQYVSEAEVLYSGLNTKLDDRLVQTVKSLTSHMDKARTEIDQLIGDQMSRIDRHASEISEEFHVQIEEITRQFINLTEGLEASFNGLLSSQIIEARDLISSTHTEFSGSLKSEMVMLKDESLKLQQEYSQEVGLKLDEVRESAATMRRTLEEFTSTKRQEISAAIQDTISNLENSVQSTDDALQELETGTIRDTSEDLSQMFEEFKASAASAQMNLSEKLSSISNAAGNELEKSIMKIGMVAEGQLAELSDLHQRTVASATKSLTSISSQLNKAVGVKMDTFQSALTGSQTECSKLRGISRDEAITAVNSRRKEATAALDMASVSFSSTLENITTTVNNLVTRVVEDIEVASKNLGKAEKSVSSHIKEKNETTLVRLEELASAHLKRLESSYKIHGTGFQESSTASLNRCEERFADIPDVLMQTIQKAIRDPVADARDKFSELTSELSSSLAECDRSSESIAEEFKLLGERAIDRFTSTHDDIVERVQQSAVLSTQQAARKFESVGLEIKTNLSSESYSLIESSRNDIAAKSLEIATSVKAANTAAEQETSSQHQLREDALNLTEEKVAKSMRRWTAEMKNASDSVKDQFDNVVSQIVQSTRGTIETLDAIVKARDELMSISTGNTWYLSGDEEVCAHIVDMASRATDSIVISVLDVSCLDIKSLAKIKDVPRRVLIVPEGEEDHADLDSLTGWRIWHTQLPVLLAIVDDREILVGGAKESDEPVIIISTDESYIRLYHDVIGPLLVRSRTT